jgi:hypothetical protein
MARGVLDRMVRYMNANVVAEGESWRGYLLRLHVEQLRSPNSKAHAAWTVGSLGLSDIPARHSGHSTQLLWLLYVEGATSVSLRQLPVSISCTGSDWPVVLGCRSMTCTGCTHTTSVSAVYI